MAPTLRRSELHYPGESEHAVEALVRQAGELGWRAWPLSERSAQIEVPRSFKAARHAAQVVVEATDLGDGSSSVTLEVRMGGLKHAAVAEELLDGLGFTPADAPDAAAPTRGGGLTDELERLAALYERGVLSDGEFAAAKRRLLEG